MVKKILSVALCVAVLVFIYAPILLLVVYSFTDSRVIGRWEGFSFDLYAELFRDAEIMQILFNTIWLALVAALLSTVLGTAGAIGIFYSRRRVAKPLQAVSQIPVINAEIVTAISLALLFSAAMLYRTYFSLIVGHMVLCTPFVVLSVLPKLRQMDPNTYEAALDLGASPAKALFKVVVPQIFSGILSGFMLSITLSLDDYIVTAFTKPRMFDTISTYVYNAVRNGTNSSTPALRALSALIFVVMIAVLLVVNLRARKPAAKEAKK
ncbi:MAG TPA: ABC transporter permease [Candidatus Borkfalkia avicola]|uniref:ABC transporter permease n=1 Tax=Candidatus Borkfalkia avicola TaxID=2838503 RepID=A0A9D2D7N9_9FIRM|nr:ABC transporter permease [Candidatus Borkfalkia avicola]